MIYYNDFNLFIKNPGEKLNNRKLFYNYFETLKLASQTELHFVLFLPTVSIKKTKRF
jgi:hypothetical protein